MKHLKQVEQKCSETAVYRYGVGFILAVANALKTALKFVFKHSTEILMVVAFISMFVAGQAFESNLISIRVCILFISILATLIVTLLKIKILEERRGK
jgi:hypothetical protein